MAVVRRLVSVVTGITDHGERVYTVTLRPNQPAPRFLPGQFLHLALDPVDEGGFWPESRVFSIASAPSERQSIGITYAVKGAFTARMERELAVGGTVWIKLPYGSFVIDPADSVVLFAGGTGITAFTAFLGSLGPEHPRAVVLFYGARTSALFAYRDLVAEAMWRVPSLDATLLSEEADGRLSIDVAWPRVARLDHPVFYLSGPPAMLTALSGGLATKGIRPSDIRIDAWE